MINPEFGYYIVDNVKFEKKIEALFYSKAKNKPVEWYFQDHIYSKNLWHIEPTETLDELYDKRVRELREKYDYLILSFSGGADSNNILESFIRQNLHLDEVVTTHTSYSENVFVDLNKNNTSNYNYAAEHELNVIPRLKYVSEKLSKTKITVIDDSVSIFNVLNQYNDENWVFKRNDHLGAIMPLKFNFFDTKTLRLNFDKNKKIAIIMGRDKPKLIINNNNLYTTFSDIALNTIKIEMHNTNYSNVTTEYFYWNSECLPMLTKQAHVVKRWLENNPSVRKFWMSGRSGEIRSMQENLLRNVIYTTWNNDWFQIDKPTNQWVHEYDMWFIKNPNHTTEVNNWMRGLKYVTDNLKDFILFDKKLPNQFKTFTKSYLIGQLNFKN